MTSTHEALVRRPVGEVRAQLQDSERILAALPGATLTREPDGASGSLKLKLGSLQITYRVTVRATGPGDGPLAATIAVSGKEARGAGTLAATVQVELHEADDDATTLRALLDVTATGRGETVAAEAWGRAADTLLAGVVAALREAAAEPAPTVSAAPAAAVTAAPPPAPRPAPIVDEPRRPQLPVETSAGPSPQRLAAVAAFVLLLLLVARSARRRRSG
jgi:carbon monoxide dehydrogenase subunit G